VPEPLAPLQSNHIRSASETPDTKKPSTAKLDLSEAQIKANAFILENTAFAIDADTVTQFYNPNRDAGDHDLALTIEAGKVIIKGVDAQGRKFTEDSQGQRVFEQPAAAVVVAPPKPPPPKDTRSVEDIYGPPVWGVPKPGINTREEQLARMQELASRADARTQVIEPINNADGYNADGVFRVVISGTSADIGKAERRGELALQGIVPSQLTTDTFVGPLTAEQQILLAQTGRLYDENAAAHAAQLGGQNQLATFPALAFASVGTAPLGPFVGAAGTRVLVGLTDLGAWLATRAAAALGAAAADIAAFGVGVLGGVGIGLIMHAPQTGGDQSITDLGNGQRFIKMGDMRTGELQERNALGEWQTVENGYGVALYVIGGQRVVLTPEEAAKFRPVPSPRPEPQGPPILPGAPIPVPTKPPEGGYIPEPVTDGVEIYPVAEPLTWEDLMLNARHGITNPDIERLKIPSVPDGVTPNEFGKKVIQWGTGAQAAIDREKNLTVNDVEEMKSKGLTREMATAWRDYYVNDQLRNANNPTAKNRIPLMEKILQLMK
jgi:hypothetical protein